MRIPRWLIPAVLLVVMLDQWSSATGAADPYRIPILDNSISIPALARGLGIMLSISYGIDSIYLFLTSPIVWIRSLGFILIAFVGAMLVIETTVITPWIISSMSGTPIAQTLKAIKFFGLEPGEQIFFGWALMVSIMPPLGVIISAIAGLAPQIQTNKPIDTTQPDKPKRRYVKRAIVPMIEMPKPSDDGKNGLPLPPRPRKETVK